MIVETRALLSGQKIPKIGFGTWEIGEAEAEAAVRAAIEAGYRLIDTAKIYANESAVGAAVRSSDVDRSELFITTKLWNDDQGGASTLAACDASLQRLGLDYLDLYLIHWPATHRRTQSWQAFTELQNQGKVRAIGVSNYTVRHLEEVLAASSVVPAVNQIEFHPYIYEQQKPVLEFCRQHDIVVEAYSPLSRLTKQPHGTVQAIAKKLGRDPAQIVLRWCLQHDTIPLPRSHNPEHIRANLAVFDFELDVEQMQALDAISDGGRVTWDPEAMH